MIHAWLHLEDGSTLIGIEEKGWMANEPRRIYSREYMVIEIPYLYAGADAKCLLRMVSTRSAKIIYAKELVRAETTRKQNREQIEDMIQFIKDEPKRRQRQTILDAITKDEKPQHDATHQAPRRRLM